VAVGVFEEIHGSTEIVTMSSSVFLSSEGSEHNSATHSPATPTTKVYTVGDAAKQVVASITTVKRIATELRLNILQTEGGVWILTEDQVAKIKKERVRRQQEAWR
jgi:hypothetical protein